MPDVKLYLCPTAAKLVKEISAAVNGAGDVAAITIGSAVIYVDPPTDRLRRHEAVHVQQQAAMAPWWARWLPLSVRAWAGLPKFLQQYLAEHQAHGYDGNKFEIEARKAE